MKYKAAVVIQESAGLALVSVSRQHARSSFPFFFFFLVFEFLKNLPVTIVPGVFDVNS